MIILGDWDDALLHARVGVSLVEDETQVWLSAQAHAALGSLFASKGEWLSAEEHVNAALEAAVVLGTHEAQFTARIAASAMARAHDDPVGVIAALSPLVGDGESRSLTMFTSLGWWPPLIHALIDHGDTGLAEIHIRRCKWLHPIAQSICKLGSRGCRPVSCWPGATRSGHPPVLRRPLAA